MSLTRQELLDRLKLHEDSFVERKPEGGEWKPTLVAFANSVPHGREAVLYIGVRDDGTIVGLSNADSIQKKVQTFCSESCFPPISFTSELLPIGDQQVLAIVIPPSAKRPHFAGAAYVRQGTKNIAANESLFEELVTSRTALAAELLKYRNTLVTVVSAKARLGYPEFDEMRAGTTLRGQLKREECRLLDVNPFFARFELRSSIFSEPLRNLTISYDEEKYRPLILIRLDGA